MEVHAHTHTSRKKWTHYFWEFLMLFLAVFCGFLAENKREHIVERHRAKDYAKSLVADLKADLKELTSGIEFTNFHIDCIEKLNAMDLGDKETVPGEFYFYSRFSSNTYTIDWSRSTLQQLVQSGNLRYFGDKELVDEINEYFSLQESIGSFNQTDLQHRNFLTELRNRIIRPKYYTIFSKVSPKSVVEGLPLGSEIDSLSRQRLALQPGSFTLIETFLNHLSDRKWRLSQVADVFYPRAIETANNILKRIKDNYHIE